MRHIGFVFTIALSVAAASCGTPNQSGAPASSAQPSAAAQPAASAPATADHNGRAIEITADDSIKYNTAEIHAKPGERLSVTLVNAGSMPKLSMGHNWILLKAGADVDAYVAAAATAPTTDYEPASKKDEVLAATKLLGPGERDTVTFDAPTTPGRYVYLCSFPGHYQVGMHGVLIVE